MNEHAKNKIEQFKNKIDYNSTLTAVDTSKAVVFSNFNPQEWPFLSEVAPNAQIIEDEFVNQNGISKNIQIVLGENILYLNIFISSSGHEPAMERLLNEALSTTMMVNPHEKCPFNLGDINISVIINDSYNIKWTYYNVYFSVKYNGNKVNIDQFCHKLQQFTEKFVVGNYNDFRPKFDEIIVSSSTIKVGEEMTVYIIPEYGRAFKDTKKVSVNNLRLETKWRGEVLSLEKETSFFFRFKGVKKGTETITFILADMDALTCSKREVKLTVTE